MCVCVCVHACVSLSLSLSLSLPLPPSLFLDPCNGLKFRTCTYQKRGTVDVKETRYRSKKTHYMQTDIQTQACPRTPRERARVLSLTSSRQFCMCMHTDTSILSLPLSFSLLFSLHVSACLIPTNPAPTKLIQRPLRPSPSPSFSLALLLYVPNPTPTMAAGGPINGGGACFFQGVQIAFEPTERNTCKYREGHTDRRVGGSRELAILMVLRYGSAMLTVRRDLDTCVCVCVCVFTHICDGEVPD